MTEMLNTEVAVIGAGTAGLTAFHEVRRAGRDALLIDHGPLGTTCARVGCMPSKAVLHAAHKWSILQELAGSQPTIASVTADDLWRQALAMRDMLGEGARTAADARRYFDAYAYAIEAIGRAAGANKLPDRPGISVKLSALYPKYDFLHAEAAKAALVPMIRDLAIKARDADIRRYPPADAGPLRDALALIPEHTILQLIYQQKTYESHAKDHEFSRTSMKEHWHSGYEDTRQTLTRKDWLTIPPDGGGIVTHDVHRDFERR